MLRKELVGRRIDAVARDYGHTTDDATEDSFAGAGSTLVAAHELGRRFIGIELDQQHHRTASARLREREPA